jgi:hypothetical protein
MAFSSFVLYYRNIDYLSKPFPRRKLMRKLFSSFGLYIIIGAVVGLILTPYVMSHISSTESSETENKARKRSHEMSKQYPPLPQQLRHLAPSQEFHKKYIILSDQEQSVMKDIFNAKFKDCMDIGIAFFKKQGEKPHIRSLREGCFEESYEFIEQQI